MFAATGPEQIGLRVRAEAAGRLLRCGTILVRKARSVRQWRKSPPGMAPKSTTRIGERERPIVFHHGWPLSSDDWDAQMLFFLHQGFRVIAHDRRGHGLSSQTWHGNDMDTYADDMAQLVCRARSAERCSRGPFNGWRRGGTVCCPAWPGTCGEGGIDRRGAADHGQECNQPRRLADRGIRQLPRRLGGQPRAILPRCSVGALLRLQQVRRQGFGGRYRQLVAPGHDGGRQGALRLHRGILRDGFYRRPAGDRAADTGDAR